ncbi:hypothetical protein ACFLTH_12760, partial [Bacteroidota bacterium]
MKHALVMLGVFIHEDEIARIAGSNWWAGTTEIGLQKVARRYKCNMKYLQSSNPDDARRALNTELKKGRPCILSINKWEHWVTAVNYSRGYYVIIDSEYSKVITIKSASQLLKKWKYKDLYEGFTSYDAYAIYPKSRKYSKAKFKLADAKALMYKKNSDLAQKWDQYFNDLISVAKPRTKLSINFITFSEFLRRNKENLVDKVANWHGNPSHNELGRILSNMEFVADVYDLIIPWDDEKKALIDVTSLLMMFA